MDAITTQIISGYVASRQKSGKRKSGKPGEAAKTLQVTTINRELQVLRRMLALASEWGKFEKIAPKVRMIPGERHRERVLRADEEARYFKAATELGQSLEAAYQAALEGIRGETRPTASQS